MTTESNNYKELFNVLCESYSTLRRHCLTLSESEEGQNAYCPEVPRELSDPLTCITPATNERDVFVLSIINWDFRFQRPQHLAKELAKKSRVFYIEMEMSPVGDFITKVDENLYVVRLPMGQAGVVAPYSGLAKSKEVAGWIENFYKFVDSVSSTAQKTVLVQHPWWWQFTKHISPEFQVTFDCMDDISGFSNTTKEIINLEHDLIESCDHLVVSSRALYNSAKRKKKPILVRNGCALDHFKNYKNTEFTPFNRVEYVSSKNPVHVGYVGALAEWFDIELMENVVSCDSSLQFHICGAVTYNPILELDKYDNVHFYGEIPYDSVPDFISQMHVMIIPFKLTPIIQACDPVKFYEHCIMGIPTVATKMPELFRAGENVALVEGHVQFFEEIMSMSKKGKDSLYQAELRKYAEGNSWERRANHLWGMISEYPKVSIVILNYGNPAWSLGVIHSLTESGGNYPNLEIILVDNGSSIENLQEIEQGIKRFKSMAEIELIKNGENYGFAKGNNIGIEACTGEYVVLLNNDVYVSPGAIFSLVNHLDINPGVGAVGPLTNNIGNEAKLFVNYPDIDTMGKEAKRWLTGYRNMSTSLKAIAYFCVAFRTKDLEEFGLLNEIYGRGMFEDDDHCNVIRQKGYDVVLAEDAFVHHHLSATFNTIDQNKKQALFEENKKVYENRWGEWIPHVYREARPKSIVDDCK